MKRFFLIFFILVGYTVLSQEANCSVISYTQTFNLSNTVTFNYKLFATSTSSLYVERDIEKTKDKVTNSTSSIGSTKTYKTGRKNMLPSFYLNDNGDFYFREIFYNEALLVKENTSDIKLEWALENETKLIGTFKCHKATATFRGRNYIAWYAKSIPIPFGPWKLSGLPGLILEAYDDKSEVHFVATNVQINKLNNCHESIDKINLKNPLTLEGYVQKKDDILDELFRKLSSRQPAGSEPIKRDKDCTTCGGKLEYF